MALSAILGLAAFLLPFLLPKAAVSTIVAERALSLNVQLKDGKVAAFKWAPTDPYGLADYTTQFAKDHGVTRDDANVLFQKAASTGVDLGLIPLTKVTVLCTVDAAHSFFLFRTDNLDEVVRRAAASGLPIDMADAKYLAAFLRMQQLSEYGNVATEATIMLPSCIQKNSAQFASPATAYARADEADFLISAASFPHNLDKTAEHLYEQVYGKYLAPLRSEPGLRLLEVGLGCDMLDQYPAGSSALFWRQYLPRASLYFADVDQTCLEAWATANQELRNITLYGGDQANPDDLRRWVRAAGGQFDVIIDDGGHSNKQQLTTLEVLFNEGLRPGGIFIIEDLQLSYHPKWADFGPNHTSKTLAAIIESLVLRKGVRPDSLQGGAPLRLAGLKSVDCFAEACVLVKCAASDRYCDAVKVTTY